MHQVNIITWKICNEVDFFYNFQLKWFKFWYMMYTDMNIFRTQYPKSVSIYVHCFHVFLSPYQLRLMVLVQMLPIIMRDKYEQRNMLINIFYLVISGINIWCNHTGVNLLVLGINRTRKSSTNTHARRHPNKKDVSFTRNRSLHLYNIFGQEKGYHLKYDSKF